MASVATTSVTAGDAEISSAARDIAATDRIAGRIEEIVRASGYRAYTKDGVPNCRRIAMEALEAFFATGSAEVAEDVVRQSHDVALGLAHEMEMIRSSGTFRSLVDLVRQGLSSRIPGIDPDLARAFSERAVGSAVERRLTSLDDSVPFDLLDDEDVVVCYVPGLADGISLDEGVTRYRGFGSDCVSIDPDERLARFLALANVSSDEYVDAVRELRGVDLREANPDWAAFHVECDPSRERLVDGGQLLEAIDGAMYGFNPLVAFKAPARFLIERDWSLPLTVTGGVIGLHNFTNGSGDPQRFEGTFTVASAPEGFMVGEGRRCDFEEAYGFLPSTFDARVEDGHNSMMPCP